MPGERVQGGLSGEWTLSGLRGRSRGDTEPAMAPPEPEPEFDEDRPIPTKRGLLSKAEIEALLQPDLSDLDDPSDDGSQEDGTDGESLDLVLFDAEDTIAGIAPGDLQVLATRMMAALRRDGLLPLSLELGSVGAAAQDHGRGTVHLVFETSRGDPVAAMALPSALVTEVLETLCGQSPLGHDGETHFGPGEMGSQLLREAFAPLAAALAGIVGAGLALRRVETDTRFARLVEGRQGGLFFTLQAVCHQRVHRVCVSLCPVQPEPEDAAGALLGELDESGLPEHLETRLQARLAKLAVPARELAGLAHGQTILLGVPPDQSVELVTRLGGETKPVAEARIGRLGGKMAVKLSRLR